MKKLKISVLLAVVLFSAAFTHAQTVDDIIAKNIDAMGGKDKLSQISSVYMESTIQAMGNESPTSTTLLNGKGVKTETEMMGSKMVNVYTDKGGWQINPMMGITSPAPMQDDQYKAAEEEIYVSPFLDYASKGAKVELIGQEKVGVVNAYKIKFTTKDSAETFFYIDPTTYYIIEVLKNISMMGQEVELTVVNSDFRKTDDGIAFPYNSEISYGTMFSMTSTLKKVEINKPVDPSIFVMPAQ